MPATVLVGRVIRAHGVRGEVLVEPWTDLPERLRAGEELLLTQPGAGPRRVVITSSRSHLRGRLLALSEIGDREQAEAAVGALLEVERGKVPAPPSGQYYYWQLLGCSCVDRNLGVLGRVADLVEDGGGLLLDVEDEAGGHVLVPFVEAFLSGVDVARHVIQIELPEGFIEACASRSSPSSPSSSRRS